MSSAEKGQKGVASVLVLWLLIAGSAAAWIGSQRAVDRIRNTWPEAYPLLFLPHGKYLSAASFGYRNLLADTIYVWSIQYYGHRRTAEGRRYLQQIYETITELDPRFIDAYTTGALVMAADMNDPQLAIELLDLGIERNPDDWLMPLEAGWYSYMNVKDYEQAERYYELASSIPGAPAWAARLRAHMVAEQGNLQAAMIFWNEILETAENEADERTVAIASQRVADLFSEYSIQEIDLALAAFEAREGRWPESLAVLVTTGFLTTVVVDPQTRLPLNYRGDPFEFDPNTGEVTDPAQDQARNER